jgi:glycerol-3-phosphate acyltransferase PlsY
MSASVQALSAILFGYLAGSIPASYLAGRARGLDLRRHGSGNLGATNVYRMLGLAPAVAVTVFDVAKGVVSAAFLPAIFEAGDLALSRAFTPGLLPVACGTAAILGHVFPVWLGFRGGKGVATGVGVFLALSPLATLAAVLVWGVLVLLTRIVSVASLALGLCLPPLVYAEQRGEGGAGLMVGFAAAAAAFVFWTHRENLRRLSRGEERRISRTPRSSG